MNRRNAMKQDKAFYADKDGSDWYVFGDNSGFAYSQHNCRAEAEESAAQMNMKFGSLLA